MMVDASISIDQIRDFFAQVLAEDAAVLALIDDCAENLQLLPHGFVFSLPALHALLDPDANLTYPEFRELIYNSTLNQELSAFDAEVIPFKSTGKTDTSLYCLRQHQQA
jgi:hypothetical protein